jgi:hypothetical protein
MPRYFDVIHTHARTSYWHVQFRGACCATQSFLLVRPYAVWHFMPVVEVPRRNCISLRGQCEGEILVKP